jgi:hypothetical protein
MKSRLALGVGALLCVGGFVAGVSGSFAQEAKIGSASITLTSPKGQCRLSNETDEALISRIRELVGDGNQLLALYSDCDELAQARSGNRQEFSEFATYLTDKFNLNAVARPNDLAKICAIIHAKSDQDVAEFLNMRLADVERRLDGRKLRYQFLGVLAEDSAACYWGNLQKFSTPPGTEKLQAAVSSMVVLKGKVVQYHLYAPYRGPDTITDLLDRHKDNVAAFIAANGGPKF